MGSALTRSVTLGLDQFGRERLASHAERLRVSTSLMIHQAALYYLEEASSGRAAWQLPRFVRERPATSGLDVTLELEQEDWIALEKHAAPQGATLELLLAHAVMLLLADIDSGRVAEHMLQSEPEEE